MSTPADQIAVVQPQADVAPPPVAGDAGAGAVVESTDWIDQSFQADANLAPPLPADASDDQGAETDKAGKADEGKQDLAPDKQTADPGAGAKPAKVDDATTKAATAGEYQADPELDDEANEFLKAQSAEAREGLSKRFKAASFLDNFKDPDKPKAKTRELLEASSPSQYAELEMAVMAHRLEDPAGFMQRVYDAEVAGKLPQGTYGKLAIDVYANDDKGYFVEAITGRKDIKPEEVKAALEFHDAHREEQAVALPELSDDDRYDLEQDHPKVLEFLDAMSLARKGDLPPAVASKLQKAEARIKELEGQVAGKKPEEGDKETGKDKPDAIEPAKAEAAAKVFVAARSVVLDYARNYALDPKAGLGLEVSDAERKSAPEVAEAKDDKLEFWIDGHNGKGLPDFESGLAAWGKEANAEGALLRPKFVELVKQMIYFAERNEEANAKEVAGKLKPFVDQYKNERLKHPVFASMDARIKSLMKAAGIAPKVETVIPGSGSQTVPKTGDDDDWIDKPFAADAANLLR